MILGAAVVVLSRRFQGHSYEGIFSYKWHQPGLLLTLFFLLWMINLWLDARIWQKVHSFMDNIRILKALETNLVCYTLSFITPVHSGELAGRYLMMDSHKNRQKTVFLTFWSHFPRLIIKLILGIGAFLVLWLSSANSGLWLQLLSLLAVLLILVVYFRFIRIQRWLSRRGWRNFRLGNHLLSGRPAYPEKLELLALAGTKFFTYNLQFMLLLMLWSGLPFSWEILASVVAMYVAGALLPTLPMADFLVKAGVALLVFDTGLVAEDLLLNATFVIWLFNLALPALTGAIIILRTRLMQKLKRPAAPGSLYDPLH